LLTQDEQLKIFNDDSKSSAGFSHKRTGLSGRISSKRNRRRIVRNRKDSDMKQLDPIEEKKDDPNDEKESEHDYQEEAELIVQKDASNSTSSQNQS
jgi:hypothetical protein